MNRTKKAKQNIAASIVLKVIDTIAYLLIIPVTIGYLNSYEYGIWLTINSILTWIYSFDIGLGSGLRNKLAIAIAANDDNLGRKYVSTTFFSLVVLMIFIALVGFIICNNIDWYSILNTDPMKVPNLKVVILASFAIFCITFVLNFIGNVYQAVQLPAVTSGIGVLSRVLSLVVIFILSKLTEGNLLYVAVIYSISPTILYLIMYPVTFSWLYRKFSPSFLFFNISLLKDLCSLSILFFILQISGLVLFSLTNLLISNLFGPDMVTPYNIANRYFSVVSMAFAVIIGPIWSATTDAYEKNDIGWIKSISKRILLINIAASILLLVMVVASPFIYKIWIGETVKIPTSLSFWMAIYIAIYVWSMCYSTFLNGMGKLRLQTYNTFFVAILFFPVCYFLGDTYGIIGVIVGMCLLNIPGLLFNILQFYLVINGTNKNFWLK